MQVIASSFIGSGTFCFVGFSLISWLAFVSAWFCVKFIYRFCWFATESLELIVLFVHILLPAEIIKKIVARNKSLKHRTLRVLDSF